MLTVPGDVLDLLETGRFSLRWLIKFELDSGHTGIWNDTFALSYSGVTYGPLGGNMQFSEIPSSGALSSDRLVVTVTHLRSEITTVIAGEDWHQRPATLMLAILDEAGEVSWITPRFSGFLDEIELSDAPDDLCSLTLSIESNNRALSRSVSDTRSDASQRRRSATDTFFANVTQSNTDANIYWGSKGVQQPVQAKKSFWAKLFG